MWKLRKRLAIKLSVLPYVECNQMQTKEMTKTKKAFSDENHSFLTTEKINITKINVGAMTKIER